MSDSMLNRLENRIRFLHENSIEVNSTNSLIETLKSNENSDRKYGDNLLTRTFTYVPGKDAYMSTDLEV